MDLGLFGHYLGVAIGFVTITLVFGLAAAGVALLLQWLFKIRGRATRAAIQRLLVVEMDLRPHEAARFADELVRMRSAGESESTQKNSVMRYARRLYAWLEGPRDWFISSERLKDVIAAPEQYDQLQMRVRRRFASMMSFMFVISSLAIAAALQLSAPDLFRDLSVDSGLYAQVFELNKRLEQITSTPRKPPKTYRDVSDAVLRKMQQSLPQLSDEFEQVSGVAVDKADALRELSLILRGHPERPEALKRYAQFIDEAVSGPQQAEEQARKLTQADLSTIHIRFWGNGAQFYYNAASGRPRWDNVVGVLIMAILLTLVAGLWHRQLDRLGSVGQVLRRPRKLAKTEDTAADRA